MLGVGIFIRVDPVSTVIINIWFDLIEFIDRSFAVEMDHVSILWGMPENNV